ncbi:helix-turn-helix domain-containing protein [uncultured Bacteroides sp.]|uniref:helix-turn-helix domain-containing protein n=1 Tax=uncultured Bacteroides sp. TaxID=162156 RepID=UPI0025E2C544|nr:helix-turn-helix domain-containing protein [uncultured Bacteroides sp.]
MNKILKVKNVGDYSRWVGHTDRHPLVSVIDYAEVSPVRHSLNNYSIYGIFFHDEAEIDLAYGCGKYDYKKGTVICVAPGQIGGKEDNGERVMLTGWALLFHPDLLHGTPLEKAIKNYSFFDYRVNEALHMTDEEHGILTSLMRQIRDELQKRHDELQNSIIVGYIELVLNFCQRFYNRQFITRKLDNSDMLMKFDRLLHDYFDGNMQLTHGLPTVQYCADKLCMSSNYFGDMIKKTTGDTASNYIRQYIIQRAKNELATGESIARVAYGLGFEYPQHLSRMFKKLTGMTPSEYCVSIQKRK